MSEVNISLTVKGLNGNTQQSTNPITYVILKKTPNSTKAIGNRSSIVISDSLFFVQDCNCEETTQWMMEVCTRTNHRGRN